MRDEADTAELANSNAELQNMLGEALGELRYLKDSRSFAHRALKLLRMSADMGAEEANRRLKSAEAATVQARQDTQGQALTLEFQISALQLEVQQWKRRAALVQLRLDSLHEDMGHLRILQHSTVQEYQYLHTRCKLAKDLNKQAQRLTQQAEASCKQTELRCQQAEARCAYLEEGLEKARIQATNNEAALNLRLQEHQRELQEQKQIQLKQQEEFLRLEREHQDLLKKYMELQEEVNAKDLQIQELSQRLEEQTVPPPQESSPVEGPTNQDGDPRPVLEVNDQKGALEVSDPNSTHEVIEQICSFEVNDGNSAQEGNDQKGANAIVEEPGDEAEKKRKSGRPLGVSKIDLRTVWGNRTPALEAPAGPPQGGTETKAANEAPQGGDQEAQNAVIIQPGPAFTSQDSARTELPSPNPIARPPAAAHKPGSKLERNPMAALNSRVLAAAATRERQGGYKANTHQQVGIRRSQNRPAQTGKGSKRKLQPSSYMDDTLPRDLLLGPGPGIKVPKLRKPGA